MKKGFSFGIIIFVVGIAAAGFIGYVASKEAYRNKKIEQEIAALQAEAEKIKRENGVLEEKIAYFETPEFKEKVAKEKLNLQKPDEQVVVVKPSVNLGKDMGTQEVAGVAQEQPQEPNYLKWWNHFFKY